jgi:hypothetical protein
LSLQLVSLFYVLPFSFFSFHFFEFLCMFPHFCFLVLSLFSKIHAFFTCATFYYFRFTIFCFHLCFQGFSFLTYAISSKPFLSNISNLHNTFNLRQQFFVSICCKFVLILNFLVFNCYSFFFSIDLSDIIKIWHVTIENMFVMWSCNDFLSICGYWMAVGDVQE